MTVYVSVSRNLHQHKVIKENIKIITLCETLSIIYYLSIYLLVIIYLRVCYLPYNCYYTKTSVLIFINILLYYSTKFLLYTVFYNLHSSYLFNFQAISFLIIVIQRGLVVPLQENIQFDEN